MIRAIAIDDEPPALEVLRLHADKIPFIKLVAQFHNAADAMTYLQQNPVDLAFLDVEMPDIKGTELAQLLRQLGVEVIFCTAHLQYAIDGFEINALDYLLKPVESNRFLQACTRAFQKIGKEKGESASIFLKDGYEWVRVTLSKVLYIQSDSNLLFIYQNDGTRVSTRMTVRDLLMILPPQRFIRTHKSFVVSVDAIRKIERHQVTVGDRTIPVAESYREGLEKMLLGNRSPGA